MIQKIRFNSNLNQWLKCLDIQLNKPTIPIEKNSFKLLSESINKYVVKCQPSPLFQKVIKIFDLTVISSTFDTLLM